MFSKYAPWSLKTPAFACRFVTVALLLFSCIGINAQNAIVTENSLPGNPDSEWDIEGAGDLSIQGFATDISYNKGERVEFKIKTNASNYKIDIYRLGYYQGNGARKTGSGVVTASLPQTQPSPLEDDATGLVDCGNWNVSAYWDIPSNAVSGVYIAKLTRSDNSGSSHIIFIVRDDASHSDLFFQTSDATWQAYNVWGGNSLYVGTTFYASGHAAKVSYNRPFITRDGGGGGGAAEDWIFNAEYPMIRWLERNGYDVSYTTNVDSDRRGVLIRNHKIFLSVGHDEYWSAGQRSQVEQARNAGVHLAFFSGNEVYWKTRWEPSIAPGAVGYRTLVCYKEGSMGENVCGDKCDPLPNEWTGLWRDGCSYPAADGCDPENSLTGQISWDDVEGAIQVPSSFKFHRFWRNTSIASLIPGQTATLADRTLGYEWDFEQFNAYYPNGRITLSQTVLNSHIHRLSLYRHSGGALVFGAGTVQWSWGLDATHDRGTSTEDVRMQQATVNLFADMGVQPATLQSALVPALASTDFTAPVTSINSHHTGDTVAAYSTITLAGTATDNEVLAGVEVSTDGGVTWQTASINGGNWSFSWQTQGAGTYTVQCRGFDDSGNMEATAGGIDIVVSGSATFHCPCTVFQPSDLPAYPLNDDGQPMELGMKFKPTVNGFITGARFYKGPGNNGTHVAHLWKRNGQLLAEKPFDSETADGWQQTLFDAPVAVSADSVYVISYHSSSGQYSNTDDFFLTEIVNGPLTALANGDDPNGVYKYSATPAFPTEDFHSANYWVDAVFSLEAGEDLAPPVISTTVPAALGAGVGTNTAVVATFNEPMNPSTISGATFGLQTLSGVTVPASVTYDANTYKAILTPSSPLAYSTTYKATIKGGTGYDRVKDAAGNAMAADYEWTFTTEISIPDISIGSDITDNFFAAEGAEITIVFNISEIGGSPAVGDTLRIFRPANYAFIFEDSLTSIDIGGTVYSLDNPRWSVSSTASSYSLILNRDPEGQNRLNADQRVFVAVRLKRNTLNKSVFSLSSQLRRANGEVFLLNNNNAILLVAQ